jgi:hypothetical protein
MFVLFRVSGRFVYTKIDMKFWQFIIHFFHCFIAIGRVNWFSEFILSFKNGKNIFKQSFNLNWRSKEKDFRLKLKAIFYLPTRPENLAKTFSTSLSTQHYL